LLWAWLECRSCPTDPDSRPEQPDTSEWRIGSVFASLALPVTVTVRVVRTPGVAGTARLAHIDSSSSGVSGRVPQARESCLTATTGKIKQIYDPTLSIPVDSLTHVNRMTDCES